ncbi:hypothetical protein KR222_006018 [Zaprionus bogoriensis]|nr:hypothetical protein KR222_006018 [Zaprionus bogoriensis]
MHTTWHLAGFFTWFALGTALAPQDQYRQELRQLLQQVLWGARVERCQAIVTDELHWELYDKDYFEAVGRQPRPYFMMRVNASQDLQSPDGQTQRVLRSIKASGCDLHVITLLNGWQVQQLLRFVYDTRALHMQQKFLLLHDERLFKPDMLHLWSVFVRAVFLKHHTQGRFSIASIAYPGILSGILVLKQLTLWTPGKRLRAQSLFQDNTRNLLGARLPVAIAEHVPMVHLNRSTNSYQGVEVEIVAALAKTLTFQPLYYTLNENEAAEEEQTLPENETHLETGLIGEVAHHKARFGIGDLHLFQSYLPLVELSAPHSVECLTFLTPESSADNSWQTFILPFSGGMWAGVLLSLFVVGSVFYAISFLNALLQSGSGQLGRYFGCLRRRRQQRQRMQFNWRQLDFRIELGRYGAQKHMGSSMSGRDLFDDYSNCILLTYSMLLYVALPRMPRNWPLRILTGWYWIYCILLVATYRASFTAILANPAARVTIDTLQDLNQARILPMTQAVEHKAFFLDSTDEEARDVGVKMDIVEDNNQLTECIAKGLCAYYDNEFYLRYLRVADDSRGMGSTALHIMKECVIRMPVVLALEKNSALKPRVDDIIQRLSEAGLIAKWLRDAISRLPAEEQAPQEALMNLKKFWSSFVALCAGYFISICALLAEHWHFRYIVMRHPLYDVYNPSLYYNYRRIYPDT